MVKLCPAEKWVQARIPGPAGLLIFLGYSHEIRASPHFFEHGNSAGLLAPAFSRNPNHLEPRRSTTRVSPGAVGFRSALCFIVETSLPAGQVIRTRWKASAAPPLNPPNSSRSRIWTHWPGREPGEFVRWRLPPAHRGRNLRRAAMKNASIRSRARRRCSHASVV